MDPAQGHLAYCARPQQISFKKERVVDYTIMQYNKNTNEYERLADVQAPTSEKAKAKYIREAKWQPKEGVTLFAKLPLCR